MNILCIYKDHSQGNQPFVADGVFDGELANDGRLLFSGWASTQDIIDAVNSPYFGMKIDLIVLDLTARNAIHWNEDFTLHDGGKVIVTNQQKLTVA